MKLQNQLTVKEISFLKNELKQLFNKEMSLLSLIKPEEILDANELKIFKEIDDSRKKIDKEYKLHSQLFVIMKATRLCNLRCIYCHSWKDGPNQRMSFSILCKTISDVLIDENVHKIEFIWHGGETLIMPEKFYLKGLWLQEYFKRPNQTIGNSLQTNATILNMQWINFFKKYNFSIGVSLDGPPEINDLQRVYKNGNPTSQIIKNNLDLLRTNGVEAGILLVVDEKTIKYGAKRIIEYLISLNIRSIALLNVIPDNNEHGRYLKFNTYVSFLIEMFDAWFNYYKDKINIRELASLYNQVKGSSPSICVFAGNCLGQFLTIEPEGNVSACDKYIGNKNYFFGNVKDQNLSKLVSTSANFSEQNIHINLQHKTFSECKHFSICNGGCPHDNLLKYDNFKSSCCGLKPLIEYISSITNN